MTPSEYQNPILCADYSDPDIVRVGDDFFMVSSSFNHVPALPILHSTDLVNWTIINHVMDELPLPGYDRYQPGKGVWAPSIRWHDGKLWVCFSTPDEGIFICHTEDPWGEWSAPHCLREARGWIDPCPFWDDDGNAYMAHAYAKSRCGIKHRIDVCRMAPDASRLLDDGVEVFNNELMHPTMEGPKFYKRNGWYYIFAPAGGVGTGWQVALRSRSPLGPYEQKIVLHQGNARTNGPHQGAWIDTPAGKDWFFHFQDDGDYGRILHLQPMTWCEDWPFIGLEQNGDGIGEPVESWPLPLPEVDAPYELTADDDFSKGLGIQWQWQANPKKEWYTAENGALTLPVLPCARGESLLWYMPNVLTQMPQARAFTMQTTVTLAADGNGDEAGIAVMGHDYSALALHRGAAGNELVILAAEIQYDNGFLLHGCTPFSMYVIFVVCHIFISIPHCTPKNNIKTGAHLTVSA